MRNPRARVLVASLALSAGAAEAQATMYTDQFMVGNEPGAIAIVADRVASVVNATRVTSLSASGSVEFERRATCIIAINHRKPTDVGSEAFVGVQIVKFYSSHDSPGVVQVARNAGWRSVRDRRELPEIRKPIELVATSISDFSALHSGPGEATDHPLLLGTRHTIEWHGQADASDPQTDSAADANLTFWSHNPLELKHVKELHAPATGEAPAVRVDNRLIRFQWTDGVSVRKMPAVEFSCSDPYLLSVAIRVYRPFSDEPEGMGHLVFK
jgi:hypothetical protein